MSRWLMIFLLGTAWQVLDAGDASNKLLGGTLGRDLIAEAKTTFTADTPKLYLRWRGQALTAGDKIRCVWIAEDVGNAAPANYHIDESVVTVDAPETASNFVLTQPKAGWPIGKYRAELYVADELKATFPFTIEPPPD